VLFVIENVDRYYNYPAKCKNPYSHLMVKKQFYVYLKQCVLQVASYV
jgi:hypothetical protein